MAKDLRSYLAELLAAHPEQLKVVSERVDPDFEAAAIVDRLEDDARYPGFPALLFEHVGDSKLPLLLNLHGTYERLALAVGTDVHGMVAEYARREGQPIPAVEVEEAPVHEVVWTGDEIDVARLPMLRHQELDAGRYLTSAITLSRDPESGAVNAGIFRHQYQGPRQIGFQVNPAHHTGYILRQYRERGEPMEVALVIGHHPAVTMGAVSKLPGVGGELEVAGGLLGEPVELVPCKTIGLRVPARAEIVIEGIVDPDPEKTEIEGPFGEYPRYYTKIGPQPYVQITAITMRRDAIFLDVFNAATEHSILGGLPRMGSIYRRVKEALPSVKAVNLPLSGMARSHLYISMKKATEGEPKIAACAAFAVDPLLKHVFVVDDDVDVFNEVDTLWCLATRFQADRDLTVLPNFLGGQLNPVTYGYHREEKGPMETKLIFDCTKPVGVDFPPMCRVPPEVVARMDPADWLSDPAELPFGVPPAGQPATASEARPAPAARRASATP